MNHFQLTILATPDQQDILISQLSDLDATGFEQTDTHLIAYFPEDNFQSYDVTELLKDFSYHTTAIQETNWNEEWEKNFQPVTIGDFCAVRADFHAPIPRVKHEIIITPKMSFGTGHHATTHMMIEQMEAIDFTSKTVFDFGTGTGVLAILAEKLGAASVVAIDVDEWSIENAGENCIRNNCSNIHLQLSTTIPADKQFDVVLANINRNVILQYIYELKKNLVPGGFILFSGLLSTDEDVIADAATLHEFQLLRKLERNNWISLLYLNQLQGSASL